MTMRALSLICATVLASGCADDAVGIDDASIPFDGSAPDGSRPVGDPDGGHPDGDSVGGPATVSVILPRTGITSDELGVLVNDDDPLSVSVAAYYVSARNIPAANVVHLHLTTNPYLSASDFALLKTQVDGALSASVQALVITWVHPFTVQSMSITSAFAMGYKAIAANNTCFDPNATYSAPNPYLGHLDSTMPFTDLAFRPTMMIPATTFAEAKTIIDHGVASDATWPTGTAYLMHTSDKDRTVRCAATGSSECEQFLNSWDGTTSGIAASVVDANYISNKTDVLFYVEGVATVTDLTTNTYLPGSIADHLTSDGGQIPVSGQTSAFEFLKAGATGSFGTVVEPCAYKQKFPNPAVYIPRYFGGNTLIEAYWKSVDWPAEGIFLGEPLARPFGNGFRITNTADTLTIETSTMVPSRSYVIEAADTAAGPFTPVLSHLTVPKFGKVSYSISPVAHAFYRFRVE